MTLNRFGTFRAANGPTPTGLAKITSQWQNLSPKERPTVCSQPVQKRRRGDMSDPSPLYRRWRNVPRHHYWSEPAMNTNDPEEQESTATKPTITIDLPLDQAQLIAGILEAERVRAEHAEERAERATRWDYEDARATVGKALQEQTPDLPEVGES